jgi:hypothetical protein
MYKSYDKNIANQRNEIDALISLKMTELAILKLYKTVMLDFMTKVKMHSYNNQKFLNNDIYQKYVLLENCNATDIKYSKLEREFIESIKKQEFFDTLFIKKLADLVFERDRCAHPVMESEELYKTCYLETKSLVNFFDVNLFSKSHYFFEKFNYEILIDKCIKKHKTISNINENYHDLKKEWENIFENILFDTKQSQFQKTYSKLFFSTKISPTELVATSKMLQMMFEFAKSNHLDFYDDKLFSSDYKYVFDEQNRLYVILWIFKHEYINYSKIKVDFPSFKNKIETKIMEPKNFNLLVNSCEFVFGKTILEIDKQFFTLEELKIIKKNDNDTFKKIDLNSNISKFHDWNIENSGENYDMYDQLFEMMNESIFELDVNTVISILNKSETSQNYSRSRYTSSSKELIDKYKLNDYMQKIPDRYTRVQGVK